MAKNKKATPEEQLEHSIDFARKEAEFSPKPTYFFNVGDKVAIGHLQDAVIDKIIDDGLLYVIDYTNVDNNYGHPIVTPHSKRVFPWHHIRPVVDDRTDTFIENENIVISFFNGSIESLLTRALSFGVDFSPKYQRGNVWTAEDDEALIDSVFKNIDIGKFCFVHNEYEDGKPGYQILDGKQRLTALVDFYLNKFPYKGKYFNELSKREQNWFCNRPVSIGDLRKINETEILKVFIMLNSTGHVMAREHLEKIQKMYEDSLKHMKN